MHSDVSAIVWFNHDLKFRRPKGIVAVKIYTADLGFGHSDRARVFGEVWRECFNEYVREFCYMADCADLSFTWNLCLDNMEMEWQGFSDSLSLYVLETLKRLIMMRDADISKTFGQVKEQLMQQMKNSYLKDSYKMAQKSFETVMVKGSFERAHLRTILNSFTYDDFASMHAHWLRTGIIMTFITGNFIQSQALELSN